MLLGRRAEPFDHPDWLFQFKYDGFRAFAFIEDGRCLLVSHNGNEFKSFEQLALDLPNEIRCDSSVLDCEIVCLDDQGRPEFADLFYRRREPAFAAFDLLSLDGKDCRSLSLINRKRQLRRVTRSGVSRVLYCEHIEQNGRSLFELACERDLEGIVAKHKAAPYTPGREQTSWFKIRNRNYSQWDGREEMFERTRESEFPQFRCE